MRLPGGISRRGLVIAAAAAAGVLACSALASRIGTALIEQAYPPAGRFVPVADGRLHVVEKIPPAGTPAGPTVVFLHGAAANLRDHDNALVERLARRYRVLLVDRPGHGWSSPAKGPDADSPRGQAAVIREGLQRVGVTSVLLVGHSWGGSAALAYALDFPQDLAGLVLLAPVTFPWAGGTAWYYDLGAARFAGSVFAHVFALPAGLLLTPVALQIVFAPNQPPPDYLTRAGARLALRPSEFLANAREVTGLKAFVTTQSTRYDRLAVPTFIISGAADAVVPPAVHARPFERASRQVTLFLLRDVGHMPHHAAPDAVAGLIEQLLLQAVGPGARR